ncbi:hypothetical protein FRC01_010289 [Tulasnella sp. 417]|nr:hypothetical protein FRC01_010289 [Tulasnella sp. 417]
MEAPNVRADIASTNERTAIASMAQVNGVYVSQKEKLGKLTHIRINPARVVIPENNRVKRGGYASVAVATLLPPENSASLSPSPADSIEGLSTKHETVDQQHHVAVKRLTVLENTDLSGLLQAFVREIGILASVRHPNIARLLGFVEDIQGRIAWMIFPWEANGNIREFLSSQRLTVPERISLINDVVAGVEYLHSREPPIWHGDLKSLNILVNDECRAVMTDFGSARVLSDGDTKKPNAERKSFFEPTPIPDDDSGVIESERPELVTVLQALTGPAWSTRWASPESLNGQSPDLPSDIWALGWVCWEIITDYLPFHGISNDANIILRVVTGKLPPIGENEHMAQIRALCGLLLDCWNPDPDRRPIARDCLHVISYMPMSIPARPSQDGGKNISSFALLMALAAAYRSQTRYSEAISEFNKAVDIFSSMEGGELRKLEALMGLGSIYNTQKQYLKAASAYSDILDIYTQLEDQQGRAKTMIKLATLYRKQSRLSEAGSLFAEAERIYVSLQDWVGKAEAARGLGLTLTSEQRYPEAMASLGDALLIFQLYGRSDAAGECTAILQRLDSQLASAQPE